MELRTLLPLAASVLMLLLSAARITAAPGGLDPAWGGAGKVTTAIGSGDDRSFAVAVQGDGKVVVAGWSYNGTDNDFAVVRYHSNGSLDTTFGGTGKVTTAIGTGNDVGLCIALQSDGKIVVAGQSTSGTTDSIAVVRYLSNGTLDNTFGGTGKVTASVGTGNSAQGVAVQSDGRIVVAGYTFIDGNNDFAIVRYLGDGTLDTTFNGTGKVAVGVGAGSDSGRALALQSDGRIVVAGDALTGSKSDFGVVRLTAAGALDPTFNGTGKATVSFGTVNDFPKGVAVQADGKILVAGYARIGTTNDFALARFDANGGPDAGFGSGGKVTTAIGSSHDFGYSVAVQANGKIVLGGFALGTNYDCALVRYLANGTLDTTFGGTGKVTTAIGSGHDQAFGLALQPDGKVLLTGFTLTGSTNDFGVLRYDGDPIAALQQWKLACLGDVNAPNGGDDDGDGAVTLLEYALESDPLAPDAATQPCAALHDYALDGERLRLVFPRDPAKNDIDYVVEATSDLAGPWATLASSLDGAVTSGPGYVGGDGGGAGIKWVEVRDVVAVGEAAQRFLRLRIVP